MHKFNTYNVDTPGSEDHAEDLKAKGTNYSCSNLVFHNTIWHLYTFSHQGFSFELSVFSDVTAVTFDAQVIGSYYCMHIYAT